jgi:hypothetical protein
VKRVWCKVPSGRISIWLEHACLGDPRQTLQPPAAILSHKLIQISLPTWRIFHKRFALCTIGCFSEQSSLHLLRADQSVSVKPGLLRVPARLASNPAEACSSNKLDSATGLCRNRDMLHHCHKPDLDRLQMTIL